MPEEVFETPQPTQTTESKQTNWPKMVLIAVLGFGLLAGAAYAGYWYGTESAKPPFGPELKVEGQPKTQIPETPTPKPTPLPVPSKPGEGPIVKVGWKLYQDEKVGYSLQYPEQWFLNDDVVELGGGEPIAQKTTQILWITTHKDTPSHQTGDLGVGDYVRLGVNYIENKEEISLKEQMRKHVRPDFADNPPENVTSNWITLSGLNAHRYIYYPGNKWGSPGVYTTIQLENGDFLKIVAIILHEFDGYLDQVIEIEDSFRTL